MNDSILLDITGTIATITMNSPEKRNALSKPTWVKLCEIFRELSKNNDLRCVVIRGQGTEAFAAGADISEFPTDRSSSELAEAYEHIVEDTIEAIETCQHPVVAMIYGACTGGGLEIACACDIRIAASNARVGVPINRLGHALAYPQLADIMALVSPAVMSELLLEGQVMDADYALRVGIVNRVVATEDLEDEVNKCASRISKGAPLATRMHKKMIRNLRRNITLSEDELREPFTMCDTEDYQNGFRSFMKKEKPVFKGK